MQARIACIVITDAPAAQAGRTEDDPSSPVLLLPRSDPQVGRFLEAIQNMTDAAGPFPVAFIGYRPEVTLVSDAEGST